VSDAGTNGPGAIVREGREARGLTCQDVADSLNLLPRVVQDIEDENWARLPGPAFARGYLRAYAKLLDIDAEEVTSAFDAVAARGEAGEISGFFPLQQPQGHGVADLMQKHPGVVLTGAVGAVICAALIVLWSVWPSQTTSVAAAPAAAESSAAQRPSGAASERTRAGDDADRAPAQIADATAADAPSPAAPQTQSADGAQRITSSGDDRLQFSFAQDCWVEIKNAQGDKVYSDLGRSGQTLELVGQRPFRILLGNAPAVKLAFNGERVALSPHTRNNVGTLVLGQ
jgi:cytoskeleton protein RodZ